MEVKDEVKKIAFEIKEDLIEIRRYLHKHPELSFKEINTSSFIKASLDKIAVPWVSITDTGVLATIKGYASAGKVIALRADIDALPIQEETGLEFQSIHPGVMHACGHDIHTASLLGVAHILQRLRDQFKGTVQLIFQPAEEILPGGARQIIDETGIFHQKKVHAILGQHVRPSIECGKIAISGGTIMASMDEIRITVKGKGGHGAQPHENRDPVVAASMLIVALQQVISRYVDPRVPSVLSFGKIVANGAINIVPDFVYIEGTFRTLDENWREGALRVIREMASSVTHGLGCTCEVDIRRGYPSLHNHEDFTGKIISYMAEYVGRENIIESDVWMASDDFAYYSLHSEACYYMLGAGCKEKQSGCLHTSTLHLAEDCIELGAGLMAYLTLKSLAE
ncbi:MAG: M20 metallopeptidase family protein [Fermentimonas sp.]|jgi:amidohydrolase